MSEKIEVLLVEDSASDVWLDKEALSGFPDVRAHFVDDGRAAMSFLRKEGPYLDAPTPQLVILDLNVPPLGGQHVLLQIKSDPALKMMPVAVFTSSMHESDMQACYAMHANCYVVKPLEADRYIEKLRNIVSFWTCVRRPDEDRASSDDVSFGAPAAPSLEELPLT